MRRRRRRRPRCKKDEGEDLGSGADLEENLKTAE